MVAVRQGDAGKARAPRGCRNARNDLEGNSLRCQQLDFFAAAPEDEGISTL